MKQVMFYDKANDKIHGGLLTDDENIICGCCGGIIPADEIGGEDDDHEILKVYDSWVNLDEAICRDDLPNDSLKGAREFCEDTINEWLEEKGWKISPELRTDMIDYLTTDFDEEMTFDDIEKAMIDCIENRKTNRPYFE